MSGGAGVGKSHTINAIYQGSIRALRKSGLPTDSVLVMMTAYTGKAASNIQGTTLHSAFSLPVRQMNQLFSYRKPSAEKLNSMRSLYVNLKIIITDEVSMCGARSLVHLSSALEDIFYRPNVPFGGISVLAVGDLLQLNPVGDLPVFKTVGDNYSALFGSLWARNFCLHELTEIVRQKGDPEFAEILSRIRIGQIEDKDVESLQLLKNTDTSSFPGDVVHVFFTNKQAAVYNSEKLQSLGCPVISVRAQDCKKDLYTNSSQVNITSESLYETGNLTRELQLAIGCRFMLTKNIDIVDHLVNGASGTVISLDIQSDKPLHGTIYVKFDDECCGMQARQRSPPHLSHCAPIKAVTAQFMLSKKLPVPVERTQYPGILAFALTVHKSQGSTYKYMHGDLTVENPGKTPTPQGLVYTMLSRVTSRAGLKLTSFTKDKIKVNKSALAEMQRLKEESPFIWKNPLTLSSNRDLVVAHLNVRSMPKHFEDMLADRCLSGVSALCVSETHLPCNTSPAQYALPGYSTLLSNTQHGIAIFIRQDLDHLSLPLPPDHLQSMACIIHSEAPLLVVVVYKPPTTDPKRFIDNLDHYLQDLPVNQYVTVVTGDFNIHETDCASTTMQNMMTKHKLKQCISESTHTHGGILDLLFSSAGSTVTGTVPVPYSDHHIIWGNVFAAT